LIRWFHNWKKMSEEEGASTVNPDGVNYKH
jgi:hypothetical protein